MRALAVVVFLLFAAPSASAAPFLQTGVDAGNTGVSTDPGPPHLAVAWEIGLPGDPAVAAPLIIDGDVYISIAEPAEILRVPLATAVPERILEAPDGRLSGLASNGTHLYFSDGQAIRAHSIEDGSEPWPPVPLGPEAGPWRCLPPKVSEAWLAMVCAPLRTPEPADCVPVLPNVCIQPTDSYGSFAIFVIDRLSGDLTYRFTPPADPSSGQSNNPGRQAGRFFERFAPALTDDLILVPFANSDGDPPAIYGWDLATGGSLGGYAEPVEDNTESPQGAARVPQQAGNAAVAIRGDAWWGKTDPLRRMYSDVEITGVPGLYSDQTTNFNGEDPGSTLLLTSNQLVVTADQVLVTHREKMFGVDPLSGGILWSMERPASLFWGQSGHMVVAGGLAYPTGSDGDVFAVAIRGDAPGTLRSRGSVPVMRSGGVYAVGDEVMVGVGLSDGEPVVRVLGEAGAGIDIRIDGLDLYPDLGVTLDLSPTRHGIFDDNTTFAVDWGDGAHADWSSGPVFHHQYLAPGAFDVVVQARNDAGQEAIERFTLQPGLRDPADRGLLETAFSAENQESTFFALGLILTLLFAGFGVVRLRRKRARLRKELAAADAILAAHRDDPDAMREALRAHRRRARRLFLDGRLDEGSTGILERHIDELLRDHRLSKVEAELGFLPHELFRAMQEMLRDARVTELERNQFLRSLDAEKALTVTQKKRVKRHVEAWHREDSV